MALATVRYGTWFEEEGPGSFSAPVESQLCQLRVTPNGRWCYVVCYAGVGSLPEEVGSAGLCSWLLHAAGPQVTEAAEPRWPASEAGIGWCSSPDLYFQFLRSVG